MSASMLLTTTFPAIFHATCLAMFVANNPAQHQLAMDAGGQVLSPISAADHVAYFVSNDEYFRPPSWIRDNFVITEGGYHIGQPSRNRLIYFADGTYLELFNWYDTPPEGDAWSGKDFGLVDWAITTPRRADVGGHYQGVVERLAAANATGDGQLGVVYPSLKEGGRTLPDGSVRRWEVSDRTFHAAERTPDKSYFPTGRLDAPFLIYQLSEPRFPDSAKTDHPCGAVGIHQVEVLVPQGWLKEYVTLFTSITSFAPEEVKGEREVYFGLGSPSQANHRPKLWVHTELDDSDREWLSTRGVGISGLSLFVPGREGHGSMTLGKDGMARRISLVW